jgi:O-antigen/teichoic acid export membrane protein
MNLKILSLKNVGSNWFGAAITLVVGFSLSPFILHKLGDDAFGLWTLIFSLSSYYGLFDLGISSSIVKYVAEFAATGDEEKLSRFINTSIAIYSSVGLVVLLITALGARYVDSMFHITPAFLSTARWLFLMVGAAVALGFPLSVFSGVLQARQMFYRIELTNATSTLLRALLIVLALLHGRGLLTIALITVALPLLGYATYIGVACRSLPIRFGGRFVHWETLRQTFRYSSYAFISQVAYRLRFQIDAVIIGAMLTASAITYFSIGSKLMAYSGLFVSGLAQIFTPMSSHFEAMGDRERLRKVLVLGNRACAMVVFPINALLLILGKSVIDVWVGPRYESSYVILVILLIPSTLFSIQSSSRQILYGIGRHQALAIVNVSEGVVNVILSIVLIRYWGIVGDAIGTAIPLTLTSVFFLPLYICRMLKVPLKDFLSEAYLAPLALCMPLVAALLFLRHRFHPHNYLQLGAEVAAGSLVYGIGLLWVFLTREAMGVELRTRFRQYVLQALGR